MVSAGSIWEEALTEIGWSGKASCRGHLISLLKKQPGVWSFFWEDTGISQRCRIAPQSWQMLWVRGVKGWPSEFAEASHLSSTWRFTLRVCLLLKFCQPCSEGTCWAVSPRRTGPHTWPAQPASKFRVGCCQLPLPALSLGNGVVTCPWVHICESFRDHEAYLL